MFLSHTNSRVIILFSIFLNKVTIIIIIKKKQKQKSYFWSSSSKCPPTRPSVGVTPNTDGSYWSVWTGCCCHCCCAGTRGRTSTAARSRPVLLLPPPHTLKLSFFLKTYWLHAAPFSSQILNFTLKTNKKGKPAFTFQWPIFFSSMRVQKRSVFTWIAGCCCKSVSEIQSKNEKKKEVVI